MFTDIPMSATLFRGRGLSGKGVILFTNVLYVLLYNFRTNHYYRAVFTSIFTPTLASAYSMFAQRSHSFIHSTVTQDVPVRVSDAVVLTFPEYNQ